MDHRNKYVAAKSAFLIGTALCVVAWSPQAFAQADNSGVSSGEIVVTARRREEVLSKVPIAITALGADALASKSIHNENDLQSAVPGLMVKQNGSANAFNYVIRGQTIDTYTNSPPGVLPYIDEAQVTTYSASSFYDLANIQVLKGPQGTLFGRNTTGGAVLFQTAQPTAEVGGYIKGRYGNFDAYQVEGAINLPISDAIRLRVAASRTGGGASILRLDTNRRYGNLEQESIRGTLLIEPVAGFKNTLVVQRTSDGGTNAPAVIYHSSPYACGNPGGNTSASDCFYAGYPYGLLPNVSPTTLGYLGLGVIGLAKEQDKLGPYKVIGANTSLAHEAASTFVINTTQYEASSNVTLKNIFMYNHSWSHEHNDYDGSPFPLIGIQGDLTPDLTGMTNENGLISDAKQFSNELQLQGRAFDGKLNYTVGLYYSHQENLTDNHVAFFNFYPIMAYGTSTYLAVRYKQLNTDDSYAAYAQGTYALTDQVNFTAGFRYTKNKNQARQPVGSDWYNCTVCGAVGTAPEFRESVTTSKPSWNVSIDYHPITSLMLYATTRGSWRAGGFNYTLPPNPIAASLGGNLFLPETTQDVEIGMKYNGRELGVPVSFNIAFYNQWVKNIQRGANISSPITGTAILTTVSVPKAQITGVETDLNVAITEWLTVGGSLAYTNARFTNNVVNIPGNPTLHYGPYADVPKWSETVFAELSKDLGKNVGKISLRGDLYAQSSYSFSNLGATLIPGTDIAGYKLVGARLAWANVAGKDITLSAFGRNLFNEKYYTGGNGTGYSAGFNAAYPGVPRTYGVEAKVAF